MHQSVFEGVLRDHLKKSGVQVELGIELVELRQGDEQVAAKLKTRDGESEESYAYVIAADGAKGQC